LGRYAIDTESRNDFFDWQSISQPIDAQPEARDVLNCRHFRDKRIEDARRASGSAEAEPVEGLREGIS